MNKVVVFKWNQSNNQRVPSGNVHKTGIHYDAEYVNRHYESLIKVAKEDFSYTCITDDPTGLSGEIKTIPLWDKCKYLGGCYNRMYVFSKDMKDLIGDKFLTVDLDTTFLKDFSSLFDNDVTTVHLTEKTNVASKKVYHPGISLIVPDSFDGVWEDFIEGDIDNNIKVSKALFNGTDQAWFNYYLKKTNKYNEIKSWTGVGHGVYLWLEFGYRKLPKNCIVVSWAGPRDPYEPKWKKRLSWLKV